MRFWRSRRVRPTTVPGEIGCCTLLALSHRSFLFWGIDNSGDVFTGFTFTLESGFPAEAIKVVLNSIYRHDRFVGELRSAID